METVKDEIKKAAQTLGLSQEEFASVPEHESVKLSQKIRHRFCALEDAHWWWESFREEHSSLYFESGKGFLRLTEICPDSEENVWFVAESSSLPSFPVYQGTVEAIQRVIGECHAFEYYLINKDCRWLVCENHHNVVYAVGSPVKERLEQLEP
jgi:hypothetical protein